MKTLFHLCAILVVSCLVAGFFPAFGARAQSDTQTALPVAGVCGYATGVPTARQPKSGLCASGIASAVVGNGPWQWTCDGFFGGVSSSCTAPVPLQQMQTSAAGQGGTPLMTSEQYRGFDESTSPNPNTVIAPAGRRLRYTRAIYAGSCGAAAAHPAIAAPTADLCAPGIPSNVIGEGPWLWSCAGFNGGPSASCEATYDFEQLGFSLSGPPTVLMSNEQRAMLGIQVGPDSPVDFFRAKNGNYYIVTSGALDETGGSVRGLLQLRVDSTLTTILPLISAGPPGRGDVRVLLANRDAECKTGGQDLPNTSAGGQACADYFDRNTIGAGTYFLCPDNTTSVFFYHGENHVSPPGVTFGSGWGGDGVAYFNTDESALERATQMPAAEDKSTSQIDGTNLANIWTQQNGVYMYPPQSRVYGIGASAVPSPDGQYVYIYHGDATTTPLYNPSACNPGGCDAVSRAPIDLFCNNVRTVSPAMFQNYYQGSFSQPGVYSVNTAFGQNAIRRFGYGTGGAFSPMIQSSGPGSMEQNASVTYIASHRLYVMARVNGPMIVFHYSKDGLTWSGAQVVVGPPTLFTPAGDAATNLYPRLNVMVGANGRETYVLTYILASQGSPWLWSELIRQPLQLNFR